MSPHHRVASVLKQAAPPLWTLMVAQYLDLDDVTGMESSPIRSTEPQEARASLLAQ